MEGVMRKLYTGVLFAAVAVAAFAMGRFTSAPVGVVAESVGTYLPSVFEMQSSVRGLSETRVDTPY
jgi:hypothetical protein